MIVTTDIVEIHWNARPHLERLGINLRRGDIDERGQRLLEQVRKGLVDAFPGSPVLLRIAVHAKTPVSGLRVLRRGVESSDCIEKVRVSIEHVIRCAEHELV